MQTKGAASARGRVTPLLSADVPLPPMDIRALTGRRDLEDYENPSGDLVYPYLDAAAYESVLDFGCGCGRTARQMLLQRTAPTRYLGIDLDARHIPWCQENLTRVAPHFQFAHHDVFNPVLNPDPDKPRQLPFPTEDASVTLVHAWSVWTHLPQPQAEFYLQESARVLRAGGLLHATFFLFEHWHFPALQPHQRALYLNMDDPTAAVYLDRTWVLEKAAECGLWAVDYRRPVRRGFQATLVLRRGGPGQHIDVPVDNEPVVYSSIWG